MVYHMFMEIDNVAVDTATWEKAKAGDKEAIEKLKQDLNGVELYMHALSTDSPPYTWVSLRELHAAHVVDFVEIKTRGINW